MEYLNIKHGSKVKIGGMIIVLNVLTEKPVRHLSNNPNINPNLQENANRL